MIVLTPRAPYTTAEVAKNVKKTHEDVDKVLNLMPLEEAARLYLEWESRMPARV
ncbi:MAG: hypothetical protein DDT34_02185 [Firmicutes bacterium]|nr:hypothetical protein [Bacillota bacterium]